VSAFELNERLENNRESVKPSFKTKALESVLKLRYNIHTQRSFLATYNPVIGIEVFVHHDRWLLKLLAKPFSVWILPVLSTRCFHQWGGAKMMLRELKSWMKPGDFVYKTDVYNYYASVNHNILFRQLLSIHWPFRFFGRLVAYCDRTILRIGSFNHCTIGIPKGSSLSPALAALYLTPLDHAMEAWVKRGDCFYAKFQDNIILISRKRHVLKRMKKEMHAVLKNLRLSLRPEKTFVGRSDEGFDLLGYDITPNRFSPNQKTKEKAFENAKRRYAQGGKLSFAEYLGRWRARIHAGLPFKIERVEEAVESIRNAVTETQSIYMSRHQSRFRCARRSFEDLLVKNLLNTSNHRFLSLVNY